MSIRALHRKVVWFDKRGRRCITFIPIWRTRRAVSSRPEFAHWGHVDASPSPPPPAVELDDKEET